jgi:hypothetical protein
MCVVMLTVVVRYSLLSLFVILLCVVNCANRMSVSICYMQESSVVLLYCPVCVPVTECHLCQNEHDVACLFV